MSPLDHNFHLLLVEDDLATRNLLATYLEGHGVRVTRASDGQQAWTLFQQNVPDVVLTDLMMPWVGGAEFIRLVRGHPRGGRIPVVVATAATSSTERAEQLTATLGVQLVLSKPLVLKELRQQLGMCVQQARALGATSLLPTLVPLAPPADMLPGLVTDVGAVATPQDEEGVEHWPNSVATLTRTLMRLRHQQLTALVVVRTSRGVWQLVMDRGALVGGASSDPAASLANSLMADCALTAAQTAQAAQLMVKQHMSFPQAAVEVMGVEPWVVASAMERHLRRVAWHALSATDGEHSVLPWTLHTFLTAEFVVDPLDVVQDVALRPLDGRMVQDTLQAWFGQLMPHRGLLAARLRLLEQRLERQSAALHVALPPEGALLDGWLDMLTPEAQPQALALLLCSQTDPDLDPLDALDSVSNGLASQDGADWNTPGLPAPDRLARNLVAHEVVRAHAQDAYGLVGVPRLQAAPKDVARAVEALRARLNATTFDHVDLGPARAALSQVRMRVKSAADMLAREVERRAYDSTLPRATLAPAFSTGPRPALPAPPPPPPESPKAVLGPYALHERMAVGGAAEVFTGSDTRDARRVVVKRLRPDRELDLPVVTGFIRECDLCVRLNHRHVVRGFERGMHQGLPYLVMEWVDGVDMERALVQAQGQKASVPLGVWTYVVMAMLDGLEHLHQSKDAEGIPLGAVHRDLAPRNVLLSWDGQVKLADFGACIYTLTELPPTEVVGSAGYLSPEQARMDLLDARSDVFAAGCVLYRSLVGRTAFDVEDKDDALILERHREGVIRALPADVPDALTKLVEAACAPDRDDRYASAHALAQALRQVRREVGHTQGRAELAETLKALFGRA